MIRIGTAGWSIPKAERDRFPQGASILERYAQVFDLVEINTSFYRPHQPKTYARWAETAPAGFRFAVKLPKTITHERRLTEVSEPLDRFLSEVSALGDKLGPLLIQLPPSLAFDPAVAEPFLTLLRARFDGEAALEPRHASWFTVEAGALLAYHRIARVAADPALCDAAALPGGWEGFAYWRLHGSPQLYATPYGEARIAALATKLNGPTYVVFDNTMTGAATIDALMLQCVLRESPSDAKLAP